MDKLELLADAIRSGLSQLVATGLGRANFGDKCEITSTSSEDEVTFTLETEADEVFRVVVTAGTED